LFRYRDAFQSKFYFDRLRQRNDIPFHWHYNILEAVIKNAYIVQQVQLLSDETKDYDILDLGCGSGHVSMAIGRLNKARLIGFDLKVSRSTRINIHKYNLKNMLMRNPSKVQITRSSHIDFFLKSKQKFDLIIDNCSVTHFDTSPSNSINQGWRWIIENLGNYLKPGGNFISATDVGTNQSFNSEFCNEADLLSSFTEFGWELKNIDKVQIDAETDILLSKFLNQVLSESFLRLPPPNTLNNGVLGIIGFVANKK